MWGSLKKFHGPPLSIPPTLTRFNRLSTTPHHLTINESLVTHQPQAEERLTKQKLKPRQGSQWVHSQHAPQPQKLHTKTRQWIDEQSSSNESATLMDCYDSTLFKRRIAQNLQFSSPAHHPLPLKRDKQRKISTKTDPLLPTKTGSSHLRTGRRPKSPPALSCLDIDSGYSSLPSFSPVTGLEWSPTSSPPSSPLLIDLNTPQSLVRNCLSLSPLIVFAGANSDQPLAMIESSRSTVRPATEKEDSSLSAVARAINYRIMFSELPIRTSMLTSKCC